MPNDTFLNVVLGAVFMFSWAGKNELLDVVGPSGLAQLASGAIDEVAASRVAVQVAHGVRRAVIEPTVRVLR